MVGGTSRGDGTRTHEHTHAALVVALVTRQFSGNNTGFCCCSGLRDPNTIKGKGKIYLITPKGHTNPIMSDFCK